MDDFYTNLAEALEEDSVEADDLLSELDDWDSLGVLSVVAMIEEKYGVALGSKEISDATTAGDLAKLVEAARSQIQPRPDGGQLGQ